MVFIKVAIKEATTVAPSILDHCHGMLLGCLLLRCSLVCGYPELQTTKNGMMTSCLGEEASPASHFADEYDARVWARKYEGWGLDLLTADKIGDLRPDFRVLSV